MCEFISWIKKDNQILFLTDKEIFSSQGKERLEGCEGNDFLGHGAIRRFFAPSDENMLRGGRDREQQDFWNTETLPKQIAKLLKTPKDFEKHWGMMFTRFFQNDDLRYLIVSAPESYKEKAWKQLLKQEPNNFNLHRIIEDAPESYKAKAWKQFLKQKPSISDLRYIVEYAPEPYRSRARKILDQR